jgi:hypothetical protein
MKELLQWETASMVEGSEKVYLQANPCHLLKLKER